MKSLSRVRLFATPSTVAHQAPLSTGISRQEHWSGLPCPPPGAPPDPGIKAGSPALQAGSSQPEPPGRWRAWGTGAGGCEECPWRAQRPQGPGPQPQPWCRPRVLSPMFTGLPSWPRWLRICLQRGRPRFDPWVKKILWRRKWQPPPIFLPGESQG